jgi:hypothetical protein
MASVRKAATGCFAAALVWLGCSFVAAHGQEGSATSGFSVVVDGVASFTKTGQGAELKLQDGSMCLVSGQSPSFDLWSSLLQHAQRYHSPVYVAYEATTREVRVLLLADAYTVVSVAPDPESDGFCVSFRQSAAIHYLKRTRRNYEEMKRILEEAKRTRQQVLVTDDVQTMEIIDARFPRQGSGPFEP